MPRQERQQDVATKSESAAGALSIMIVGNVRSWTAEGRSLPASSDLTFVEFDEVTATVIREVSPDVVLSSVITPQFDAFDLAAVLCDAGYCGKYRALSPRLPEPDVVRREVRAICPDLDFDLLLINQSETVRPN